MDNDLVDRVFFHVFLHSSNCHIGHVLLAPPSYKVLIYISGAAALIRGSIEGMVQYHMAMYRIDCISVGMKVIWLVFFNSWLLTRNGSLRRPWEENGSGGLLRSQHGQQGLDEEE